LPLKISKRRGGEKKGQATCTMMVTQHQRRERGGGEKKKKKKKEREKISILALSIGRRGPGMPSSFSRPQKPGRKRGGREGTVYHIYTHQRKIGKGGERARQRPFYAGPIIKREKKVRKKNKVLRSLSQAKRGEEERENVTTAGRFDHDLHPGSTSSEQDSGKKREKGKGEGRDRRFPILTIGR